VFSPSVESGIGRQGIPKNTTYRLARDGNTLRAIYMHNPTKARADCRLAPGCDYPIVIANDDYYGGLGGEFAISTRSQLTGTVVLRHELGHNFGRVGEEYDGGGYFGANHASSLNRVSWSHWLTNPTGLRGEPAAASVIMWPWHHLANRQFQTSFTTSGRYPFWSIDVSLSGFDADEDIIVELNNQRLPFTAPGHTDRWFHSVFSEEGFSSGTQSITVRQNALDQNNWLSSLEIFEYGADYNFAPDYIGAYPVFESPGRVSGYRPTHETCLMRNMLSKDFCSVCQENNWMNFFDRITVIDSVSQRQQDGMTYVDAKVLPLAHLRPQGAQNGEQLVLQWFKDGTHQSQLDGQLQWQESTESARGRWELRAKYETPEIRHDPQSLLSDNRVINL
jgi:hypothetical protein